MVQSERMDSIEQKIDGFFNTNLFKIGTYEGEAFMNTGKDEILIFKRDGTHQYLKRNEFEEFIYGSPYIDILKIKEERKI